MRFLPEVWLCLGLLENRGIHLKVRPGQQSKDLISNRLRIFGGMEHAIEMKTPPTQLATERKQSVSRRTMTGGDGAENEVAGGAVSSREIEVPRLVGEDIAIGHSASIQYGGQQVLQAIGLFELDH